jgi:D-tyrosyl-tRNA(Tyr) deacylase
VPGVRAIVQRVARAEVRVGDENVASIGPGLLVLLGVHRTDGEQNAEKMARKLAALRVFEDDHGRMSHSVGESGGEVLCVSQFTLYGDTRKGNRPSFTEAASPEVAEPLYEQVCMALGARTGRFGEHMAVELVNDGPVTLLLDV